MSTTLQDCTQPYNIGPINTMLSTTLSYCPQPYNTYRPLKHLTQPYNTVKNPNALQQYNISTLYTAFKLGTQSSKTVDSLTTH